MNESSEVNASSQIAGKTLLEQFKKVEQLPPGKKTLVKEFLDAFLIKSDLQKKFAS